MNFVLRNASTGSFNFVYVFNGTFGDATHATSSRALKRYQVQGYLRTEKSSYTFTLVGPLFERGRDDRHSKEVSPEVIC